MGLGLNAINGYQSAMIISHDEITLQIIEDLQFETLGSVGKDLITPYHMKMYQIMDQFQSTPLLPYTRSI